MSGKNNGVDREAAGLFRRLIMHLVPDGTYGPQETLFAYGYWLTGRKAAATFADHVGMFRAFTGGRMTGERLGKFEAEYPEISRYADADIGGGELTGLERKAAGMFCDGFLSRPEHPAGEGWVYVRALTRWAYTVGAADKLTALEKRGKLFTRGFRPIVTMDDMPDYTTVKAWDDRAIARMNAYAVWNEAPFAVWAAYGREAVTKWYPAYERAGIHPDRSVRTVDAVHVILAASKQGMKDSVPIFYDYLDCEHYTTGLGRPRDTKYGEPEIVGYTEDVVKPIGLTRRRRAILENTLAGGGADSAEDYSPYFMPMDGGDPVQKYAYYIDRKQGSVR